MEQDYRGTFAAVANENRGFTDIDLVGREAFEHLISLAPILS
jgi:hypothetical protein